MLNKAGWDAAQAQLAMFKEGNPHLEVYKFKYTKDDKDVIRFTIWGFNK